MGGCGGVRGLILFNGYALVAADDGSSGDGVFGKKWEQERPGEEK